MKMKNYMVVYQTDENGTGAIFRDTMGEAEKVRQDIVCGCGWDAQVYEWTKTQYCYEYVCIIV